jgi:hypothetical protein
MSTREALVALSILAACSGPAGDPDGGYGWLLRFTHP